MKLSVYARQIGVTYKTAYRWWKAGRLDAYQLETGTVIVRDPIPKHATGVALYARVSSVDQKNDLERQMERLKDYAADDDLTVAGLSPVEVASESLALAMSKFERRLRVAVGMAVPVEVRFERSDAVKDAGWRGSGGPHLAAHRINGDGETEHSTQGAAPRPGC